MNFDVNLFAVLVSGILFMIVGTLWYGPLFGKPWRKIMHITPESMKRDSKSGISMPVSMFLVFIAALVTSYVLAVVLKSLLITTVVPALSAAFILWLGFIATTMAHRIVFEKSSVSLFWINSLQSLVSLILGSLVIVLWPW